ncbi:Lrp/AsnC family transcriptional regulator [Arenibaculum pallidiluteum]|uniref:Lrp/AsnC family transcriptional regulator n=1 Tax=Arenibaculum pallidiluteum TaxID=2812559 RepID=UPI001A96FFFA|nr:Lrp/AsnC family transcriptional regulator [Arenibaculum pallidiluteum]
MQPELDALDRRILALVQEDARQPAERIGQAVGLSASAVQRRLARLRETGVIAAEVAVLDPRSLGRPLVMIVDVELERERPELLAAFRRWLAAEPAVQQAWYVTGESDYVLVVTAAAMEAYDALMQRLVAENANVRRFRTRVALGAVKRGLALPVDGA